MATDQAHYQAYMLRLWQDQDETGPVWCASLESPHTGERWGFANVEALFEFVRQEIGVVYEASEGGRKMADIKGSEMCQLGDFEIMGPHSVRFVQPAAKMVNWVQKHKF